MSEVNANITVSPISLTVTPTDNQITITPADITLGIYTAGQGTPGAAGNVGELQYNNTGVLAGASNTQVSGGNVRFQNIGNLKINGGANAYFLQTDGTGNLTWAPGTSNVSGSGTSAGANTQIQISDGSGNFTSGPGFTFDNSSNILTVPGNVYASNYIGTLANGNSNITMATSNGNIDFYVNGNTSTKITDNQLVTSNFNLTSTSIALGAASNVNTGGQGVSIGYGSGAINPGIDAVLIGDGAGRANTGANTVAVGIGAGYESMGANSVALGAYAGYNSQGNNSIIINATGSNLDGNTANAFYVKPVRNANATNVLYYDNATGEVSYDIKPASDQISNGTSNISIPVSNGNVNISSNGSANVVVVTDTGANINGNLSANYYTGNGSLLTGIVAIGGNANYANFAGTVVNGAQPNITSLGTLTSLTLNSVMVELGNGSDANVGAIALGNAWANDYSVAIGQYAGRFTTNTSPSRYSVAIGQGAGYGNARGDYSIAIGTSSGTFQAANSIALGRLSGYRAGINSIQIGANAGFGPNALANVARNNSIVLNATGANLESNYSNSFVVKPIRNATQSNYLYYDSTSGEITYDTGTGGSNTAAGANTQVQFNTANLLDASANFTFNTSTNSLTVTGTITGTTFYGAGTGLTSIPGANVTGTVANATYAISTATANTASTVTTAAQPNITSVGTLTSLAVTGNISGNNLDISRASKANVFVSKFLQSSSTGGNIGISLASYTTVQTTANATANYTLNVTGANVYLSNGECCNVRFICRNDNANTFGINDPIQVDGANVVTYMPYLNTPAVTQQAVYDIQIMKNGSGTITAAVILNKIDAQ